MTTNRLHFQIIFLIFTLFIDFEFLWSWKEIKIVKLYGNLYSINTLFLCKPKKIKRFRSQPNLPLIRKCRDIFEWLEQITVVLRFLKILSVKKTSCYFFLSFLSPFNILRNLQEKQSVKIINFWTIACLSPKTIKYWQEIISKNHFSDALKGHFSSSRYLSGGLKYNWVSY